MIKNIKKALRHAEAPSIIACAIATILAGAACLSAGYSFAAFGLFVSGIAGLGSAGELQAARAREDGIRWAVMTFLSSDGAEVIITHQSEPVSKDGADGR